MTLSPGTRIANRYEIVEELGRGGMGRVFLARDEQLDRPLAVKVLLTGDAGTEERLRFIEEAQVTGQLAHPNIVSIHELGLDGSELFLAMKLVEGRDLKAIVRLLRDGDPAAREGYKLPRLLRIFLKVCEAVAFAHEERVIHRDLKPANVMIGEGDEVLVMDWGLAKPLEESETRTRNRAPSSRNIVSQARLAASASDSEGLTQRGSIVGTPGYMPPEQLDGTSDVDERADVYALGALLYELLAYRPPYRGSLMKVVAAMTKGPPPAPSEVAPENNIPGALEGIVQKAMAPERGDRYPSVRHLARDVERFLDQRAVSAYEEKLGESIRRFLSRHRKVVWTAVLGVLFLNLLWIGGTLYLHREQVRLQDLEAESLEQRTRALEETRIAERAARLAGTLQTINEDLRAALARTTDFSRKARRATPVDALRKEAAAAGTVLTETKTRIDEALRPFADTEALRRSPIQLEDLLARWQQARAMLDLTRARVLIARAPDVATRQLPVLQLGPDRALLESRLLFRRHQPEAARKLLAGATFDSRARSTAARALLSLCEHRPLAESRRLLDEAIERNPAAAWLRLRRAEILAQLGRLEEARLDYDLATRLSPLDGLIYLSRLEHLTHPPADNEILSEVTRFVNIATPSLREMDVVRQVLNLYRRSNFQRLQTQVLDLIQSEELNRRVGLAYLARAALMERRLGDMENLARQILDEVPDDPDGLGFLAEALALQTKAAAAIDVARRGLERQPDHPRLNFAYGEALRLQQRYREALPHLERGAAPALAPLRWRRLARCCLAMGDEVSLEKGVQAARRAVGLDPIGDIYFRKKHVWPKSGDPENHRLLGHLRRRQGHPGKAILHYLRAFILSSQKYRQTHLNQPPDYEDLLTVADLHAQLNLRQEAAAYYRTIIQRTRGPVADEARKRLQRLR